MENKNPSIELWCWSICLCDSQTFPKITASENLKYCWVRTQD